MMRTSSRGAGEKPIVDARGRPIPKSDLPILICEGKDNAYVAFHVASAYNLNPYGSEIGEERNPLALDESDVLIATHDGGADESMPLLKRQLEGLLARLPTERPRAVGFLFDAEDDPDVRETRLRALTESLAKEQAEMEDEPRQIRFMPPLLVPPAGRGAIESIVLEAVKGRMMSDGCLRGYIGCLRERGGLIAARLDKVSVRTYLAAMSPGNTGLDIAFKDGHVDSKHPAFDPIRDYLRKLIEPPKSPETT